MEEAAACEELCTAEPKEAWDRELSPGSLCECSSAPAHVLPKPGVAPEAFPSEDVAQGVAPTALGGSFIHLHAPLSSSFLSHAALVLAGH